MALASTATTIRIGALFVGFELILGGTGKKSVFGAYIGFGAR